MIQVVHDLEDGSSENTWLTFRQVGDEWLINQLIGYPHRAHAGSGHRGTKHQMNLVFGAS